MLCIGLRRGYASDGQGLALARMPADPCRGRSRPVHRVGIHRDAGGPLSPEAVVEAIIEEPFGGAGG